MNQFETDVLARLNEASRDSTLMKARDEFLEASIASQYSYNYFWMGRPIIQYPQDIMAVQELVWQVKPDLIIETGIAHGGSLILSASLLAMLEYCDAQEAGEMLDPARPKRRVLGVDIDIRNHNREAIEAHPMANRIHMIQGSSIAPEIIGEVHEKAKSAERVIVFLDSNHTHDHVLAELEAYAPLTSEQSYCVVFDTIVERLPRTMFKDRPWGPGDNPMTAVHSWLEDHPEFEIDHEIDAKLQISVAPNGFLRRQA